MCLFTIATESPEESCTFLVQVTFNDNQYPGYHCEPTNKSFGPVTIKYFGFDFGMASVPLYSKYLMNQVGIFEVERRLPRNTL
jgi:hypothetical protein